MLIIDIAALCFAFYALYALYAPIEADGEAWPTEGE